MGAPVSYPLGSGGEARGPRPKLIYVHFQSNRIKSTCILDAVTSGTFSDACQIFPPKFRGVQAPETPPLVTALLVGNIFHVL